MVKKITKSQIIELFLNDYSRRIYLREAASELKKPHQSIKPHIKSLIDKKIVIETKRKNIVEYSLNFKNKAVYDYLTIAEKEKTQEYLKKETLVKALYERLSRYFNKNAFLIFGSSAESVKKGSDIDLLVVGKEDISKEIDEFKDIYSKEIHLIQVKSLKELDAAFIREIYKKHIIFNDTEKMVRFFGELHEQNKLV